jgi:aminoglycoside phosphotransferase (APT) family kinase protein
VAEFLPEPGADTIEVRTDEKFDEPRLADYLRDRLEGAVGPLRVRQFGGGTANLTYLLEYEPCQYVLRRPPLGPLAPSSHDMAREHRVLAVLYAAFPPAPRAFLFCDDPGVIGAPFFVMERRRGVVVRRQLPPAFAAIPDAALRMSRAFVDALADLHAVDYAALGLESLGKPAGFLERQIEGWSGRWEKARLEEIADMAWVHDWLRERCPKGGPASLVHNDYKLDNVMLAEDDPGRLVAVFDWDMATLGDPLSDLGCLLCYWSEPGDAPAFRGMAMMPTTPGFPSREELVARYAARSGRDVRDIGFYHVLGLYRLAVIAAQIFIRFHRGQTRDQRFAAFGPLVSVVAAAARHRAGRG